MAQSGRGRGGPVTMLPLFRSQTQALVLTRLLLGPGEESLTDLAIAVGSYKNAVKHEVDRLEAAGLEAAGRSAGRVWSLSARESRSGRFCSTSSCTPTARSTWSARNCRAWPGSRRPSSMARGRPGRYVNPVRRRATSMCSSSATPIAMTSSTRSDGPPPDWARRSTSTSSPRQHGPSRRVRSSPRSRRTRWPSCPWTARSLVRLRELGTRSGHDRRDARSP